MARASTIWLLEWETNEGHDHLGVFTVLHEANKFLEALDRDGIRWLSLERVPVGIGGSALRQNATQVYYWDSTHGGGVEAANG